MPAQNRQQAGLCRGYITQQHRAAFEAEREKHRPGGELAATCGARTNSGKACARLPVANGNGRCIQHCGRVVAAQFREQQRKRFVKGQISPEVWFKAEAKRATNRLRERWKKDPWYPGSTIDLGDEEDKFRAALSHQKSHFVWHAQYRQHHSSNAFPTSSVRAGRRTRRSGRLRRR